MSNNSRRIEALQPGMRANKRIMVTEDLVSRFGQLSGDKNPLHMDEEFAKKSIFRKRIAHGFIPAIFFTAIIGTELPGPGSIYLSQAINFLKPVYIGDEITVIVEIERIDSRKKIISLKTTCMVGKLVVVDGDATILFPV